MLLAAPWQAVPSYRLEWLAGATHEPRYPLLHTNTARDYLFYIILWLALSQPFGLSLMLLVSQQSLCVLALVFPKRHVGGWLCTQQLPLRGFALRTGAPAQLLLNY